MELLIENIKTASDKKRFTDLAKSLGLKVKQLSLDMEENIALGTAMKKAEKTKMHTKKEALKLLGDD